MPIRVSIELNTNLLKVLYIARQVTDSQTGINTYIVVESVKGQPDFQNLEKYYNTYATLPDETWVTGVLFQHNYSDPETVLLEKALEALHKS